MAGRFAQCRGGWSRYALASALGLAGLILTPPALAIERHLPPSQLPGDVIADHPAAGSTEDDTPIGADLKLLVFLGSADPLAVPDASAPNVDASRLPDLDTPGSLDKLRRFLGRSISQRLISEIEAAVAELYRQADRPFISVSTPPQEITGGVLQFRVVEFRVGSIAVEGATRTPTGYVTDRVRLASGEPIDSGALSEDIDWLNRTPFRQFEAVFAPGDEFGITNLTLQAREEKPWKVFAGGTLSDARTPNAARYFVGATVADVAFTDMVGAYQLTGSGDFWYADGQAFGAATHPTYVSHSGRLFVPTGPRQRIEIVGDYIETNDPHDVVDIVRKNTFEGDLLYRTALSNFGVGAGDLAAGVEVRRLQRESFVANVSVGDGTAMEVYQAALAWSNHWALGNGRTAADASVHYSPGGLGAANSDAPFAAYSGGRITNANYWYARADIQYLQPLSELISFSAALIGQGSPSPLPETEQIAIGGADAVRGYVAADGSYDSAGILRAELRLREWTSDAAVSGHALTLQPFAFADGGAAMTAHDSTGVTAASAGVGMDFSLGRNVSGSATAAYVLVNGPQSRAGEWGLAFRLTGQY